MIYRKINRGIVNGERLGEERRRSQIEEEEEEEERVNELLKGRSLWR